MQFGVPSSLVLHAALLGGMLLNLSAPDPFDVITAQAVPVDILSAEEFSQITRGSRNAEVLPTPEVQQSVGQSETPRDTATEGQGREDAATAADNANATPDSATPPPPPPPPPPEPEPEPTPEPEPAPEPEPTPVAEPEPASAQEPAPEQRAQITAPAPVARPDIAPTPRPTPQPQEPAEQPSQETEFSTDDIQALLNRDENQGGGGASDQTPATLGAPEGRDATLSESEMDALRRQIARCWNPPVGSVGAADLVVRVQMNLAEDGSLRGNAAVVNSSGNPAFQAAADSALRAVRRCAPYSLPFEKYSAWQDVIVNFDPREMLR